MTDIQLMEEAKKARKNAYAPYSNFAVGAALLTESGALYTGCNIENAAYGPGNCAERTAFFKAVSEGERSFAKIAIVGGAEGSDPVEMCAPCGICRQVMREFCDPESFEILLQDGKGRVVSFTLGQLFPHGFGPENLGR